MVQSPSTILYVNGLRGSDSAPGTASAPLKTVSRALAQARAGVVIRVAPGTYRASSGETFPLGVPAGVQVVGDEGSQGSSVILEGSGLRPTLDGDQQITVLLGDRSELRGVTVINPATSGTGVWIQGNDAPTLAHCTLKNCQREGVVVTGNARPLVQNCVFVANGSCGLAMDRNAKGELRENRFQNTGYGVSLKAAAAPLLVGNSFTENRSGLVLAGEGRPVLRNNRFENNREAGLVATQTALPDLGQGQDPGGNFFRGNGALDLHNATTLNVLSVGNHLNPTRVKGSVAFEANQILAPNPSLSPLPAPPSSPTPAPSPTTPLPTAIASGFSDLQGHWAAGFVQGLASRGLVSGFEDGTFRPNEKLTRAQYAALVSQVFDQPLVLPEPSFEDVAADFWGRGAIAKASRMGFVSGFPDNTFRPNQNLTRVQAVVSLISGLKLMGGSPNSLLVFDDRAQIPSYAADEVAAAVDRRMVVSYPNVAQLDPLRDITRAEVVALVYQSLVVQGRVPALASPYIVQPDPVSPTFSDIEGHWAADFIRALASQRLISGLPNGTFQPEGTMSRAQYAALLAKALDPAPLRPSLEFQDVPADFWAYGAIDRAYRGGFLAGVSESRFAPNRTLPRVQVIVSLASGLNLPPVEESVLDQFSDRAQIPGYARAAVAAATQGRLVVSYPSTDRLSPNRDATRAEVAAMVHQALVNQGRLGAIASPYIVIP